MPKLLAPLQDRFTMAALAVAALALTLILTLGQPNLSEARATLPEATPRAPARSARLATNLSDALQSGRTIEIGVFGDSFGDGVWWALSQQLRGDARFRLHQFSQRSTGFAGWSDLSGEVRDKLDRQPLDVAVISFGANDTHGLTVDRRHHDFMSDEWRRVVGARIDRTVSLLRGRGVQVYWIGLPRMRRPAFEAKARALNNFYASRMRAHGVPFIDTVAATTDADGLYAEHLVNPDTGRPMLARAGDGVHMSMNGYRLLTQGLARHLIRRVAAARMAAAPPRSG